jgi:predicted O-methyltransferase YrrM
MTHLELAGPLSADQSLFEQAVERLRRPDMGTEALAPYLYWLARFTRARRVVEIGAGFTSPFLARAIADNVSDTERERSMLATKTAKARSQLGLDAPDERVATEWLLDNPPLARPSYFESEYNAQLVMIDKDSQKLERVYDVLKTLDLTRYVQCISGDAQQCVGRLEPGIDLLWVDTWSTISVVDACWRLVAPTGGILAVHALLGYPEGDAVREYLGSLVAIELGRVQALDLFEGHKLAQNSLTILRRTADGVVRPSGRRYALRSSLEWLSRDRPRGERNGAQQNGHTE